MLKPYVLAVAAALLVLPSCTPPPPVPPPRFTPNPPYAPDIVGPDGQATDPDAAYGFDRPDLRDDLVEPSAPDTGNPAGEYPTATRTGNPNEVVSPYPPHKVIDVSDFGSGQLARDPWNNKIFRIP